jgi:hypothetical protein
VLLADRRAADRDLRGPRLRHRAATEDRIKRLGLALLVWMFFAVIYNGLVLLVIQLFSSTRCSRPVIAMSLLNPIDLGRILLLLNLDASALMGFTGAVFERFFGSGTGQAISLAAMLDLAGRAAAGSADAPSCGRTSDAPASSRASCGCGTS